MRTEFHIDIVRDEGGSVLIIALLILVLLTMIGISATRTTNTDIRIANNEKIHRMAFYTAEAGIEVGRAALNDLKVADSGSWDNLLQDVTTLDAVIDAGGSRNVGDASFTLEVDDNQDLDGSMLVDTDNTIILTSTGSYGNAQAQIETIVRYTGGGDQYAQEHYDTDSSGTAAGESDTVASSQRW